MIWGTSLVATAAPPGPGVSFDADSPCAVVEDGGPFNLERFTVAAWVQLRQTGGSQVFLNRGQPNELFTLYLYDDHVRMLVRHATDRYSYARVPAPPAETWVHYAGTYDGHRIQLFVDGRLQATADAPGRMADSGDALYLGAVLPGVRPLDGHLEDARIWGRVLTADEVAQVADGRRGAGLDDQLIARWTADSLDQQRWPSTAGGQIAARLVSEQTSSLGQMDGYRGIWYSNQPQGDQYVYKYSGGLGTYCAKHRPFAIYRAEVNKTFFCYGGTNEAGTTLLHMVSYYDHATGTVPRPTLLLDKRTTDAHDNPVIAIDDDGYIWIFSSSHGTARPSYLYVSDRPYSIESFTRVLKTNFSYTQPFHCSGWGFLFPQTIYRGGRAIYFQTSRDGRAWTEPRLLSLIDEGHYQISEPAGAGRLGCAFNYHPRGQGLNWRTNLYYIQTRDGGATWQNVAGQPLELPLTRPDNPALVHEYQSEGRNVYLKDLAFGADGHPVVLYVTSGGWQAGPANDPRVWQTARWTGDGWDIRGSIQSDNNYDMGSLYIEPDGRWRLLAPTQPGPQAYNPGGEVAMWISPDLGRTWQLVKQLTRDSPYNHTYVRRPIDAHPDFYALWADGHARRPSDSRLYFTNREGAHVWRLPVQMSGETAEPEIVW
jgi:hypothetical protein